MGVYSIDSKSGEMKISNITERDDLVVRRMTLDPGEAMFWHVDNCHRFTVVVRGSLLAIEYRESGTTEEIEVRSGEADWDAPDKRIHRAINKGNKTYEEVVTFYRDNPSIKPQPIYE